MKKRKSLRRSRSTGRSKAQRTSPPRKLIEFHPEDFRALEQLAEDKSSTFQELIDKAVRDFLDKSGRPTNLRDALRKSASDAQRAKTSTKKKN